MSKLVEPEANAAEESKKNKSHPGRERKTPPTKLNKIDLAKKIVYNINMEVLA